MVETTQQDGKRDDQLGRSHVTDTPELEAYYAALEKSNCGAFWKRANAIEPWEPETRYTPTLWPWKDMREHCIRAVDLVSPEEAGRRVVTLLNDSPAGREHVAAVGWLFSGMQAMKPGEITPAHKHTASAHRFIMEGSGAYTVVDGHRISLGARDYVLTPGGCWHDHGVDKDGELSIWQDGLDIPLMNALEANFYAVHDAPAQTSDHPTNDLPLLYGGASVTPETDGDWQKGYSPVMVYRWDATLSALSNMAKAKPACVYDGYMVRYSNPLTGGWAMKTMGANMQMLPSEFSGKSHRHTGNVVYNVAGGCGYSIIDGKRFDWCEHDIFCVPSWVWHEHHNVSPDNEAFLFSFNDFPVMDALGTRLQENHDETPARYPSWP